MQIAWLDATLPLWPLLSAAAVGLTLALGRGRAYADRIVVAGVALALLLSISVAGRVGGSGAHPGPAAPAGHEAAQHTAQGEHGGAARSSDALALFRWISLGGGHWVELRFFFDSLTGVMTVTVTLVSLMVVIYSIGYMRDHHGHRERGYERFFAFLALFVFSMLMLVMAGNFVLLYLGWELVGLCSYLLIGFYYSRPEAAAAAKKAFLVNRIGDFGFAIGIFALYAFISPHVRAGENPLDYEVVFRCVEAGALSTSQLTLVALLLFCGAVGKSAQFPLYVWLPDAMEGPTPVSALIHAATMVTAGVYMVARCGPIYARSPVALAVVTAVGAGTALLAATMAMAQYDMKRILAYSTISQLAFMFVGLGCGAPDSAVFHLFTHAFFKALLFLCAGSVMHAMGGVIDLRRFSGLRGVLPRTHILMLWGCLALAGFPLLSGFWSKDEIVHAAFERSTLLGLVMLATAFMTAYYTFRMFFLAFEGRERLPEEAGEHPHDSPAVMILPLRVLMVGAILGGFAGVSLFGGAAGDSFLGVLTPGGWFQSYLASSTIVRSAQHGGGAWLLYVSTLVALAGIVLAWLRYGTAPRRDPDAAALGRMWQWWHHKYWVDELNDRALVRPLRRTGRALFEIDERLIDGLVRLAAGLARGVGAGLRWMQRGSLQGYGLAMLLGLLFLMVWWLASAPAAVAAAPGG